MKKPQEIDLWRYIDGKCSAAEAQEMQEALSQDKELRSKLSELKNLDQQLSKNIKVSPSLNFTASVISRFEAQQKKQVSAVKRNYGHIQFAMICVGLLVAFFIIGFETSAAEPTIREWLPLDQLTNTLVIFTQMAGLGIIKFAAGVVAAMVVLLAIDHFLLNPNHRQPQIMAF